MDTSQSGADQTSHVEQIIAAAGPEVQAVHIVTNRRLTYPELMRCREHALTNNLTMTVIGSGGVVLRSRLVKPPLRIGSVPPNLTPEAVEPASARRSPLGFAGAGNLGQRRLGNLLAMTEGTR